jgi:tripartite-type tricarboxylate transporter receptor subunit TctC
VNKKLWVLMIVMVSSILSSPQPARAQAYPTKPIEIVVPWGPGTSVDIVARMVADLSKKYLSQPMIVTNKPGATGTVGAADVIASKPEGYKIYTNGHLYFANTINTQKLPFDPHDIVPLASFVDLRQGMVVSAESPYKTFGDLLAYAKKNPGQLKWGHGGRGIAYHLTPLLIFKREGASTIDVPFKGGTSELIPALLGKHVDMGSTIYLTMIEQARAGQVRFLMWYSDRRYKDSPNVPAITELGYHDAFLPAYQTFFIHKNTPANIRKTLVDACKKIYDDPAFQSGLARINVDPRWEEPDAINESIRKSVVIVVPILKELGLYVGK